MTTPSTSSIRVTPDAPEVPAAHEAPVTGASRTLDISGLESVYDRLAHAIDEAGPEHSERFLVKLALLNAQALGDAEQFCRHVEVALRDL
jgi:hypothetical protein